MKDYFPNVIQVIPYEDYTVDVYFDDGKIVCYNVQKSLPQKLFQRIQSYDIFIKTCTILNGTLAWDISTENDVSKCIDIDPFTLYELPPTQESTK